MENTVWNYWDKGYEQMPPLIKELYDKNKKMCEKHNYNLKLITLENVIEYLPNVPPVFFEIAPNFQSDYVRFNLLYKYGGIWMDSDALIYDNPAKFQKNLLETKKDVLVTKTNKSNNYECAIIVVRTKELPVMYFSVQHIRDVLSRKSKTMDWTEIGPDALTKAHYYFNQCFHVLHSCEFDPINYITWETGANDTCVWFKQCANHSKLIAEKISEQGYPAILTWRLYQLKDLTKINHVLNHPNSIFYHLIN